MTLDEILEIQYTSTGAMKENIVHHFLSLLPKEITGEYYKVICTKEFEDGYNQALADIKERIEKEMGNDQA